MLKSVIAFLLVFFSLPVVSQLNIEGTTDACVDVCYDYNISDGAGGPYVWKIDGGTLYNSVQGRPSITVCWEDQGTMGQVSVIDRFSQEEAQLSVDIQVYPNPDIYYPDFPICFELDTLETPGQGEVDPLNCLTACAGLSASYSALNLFPDSEAEWVVEGALSINYTDRDEINVTWPTSGFASIELIETNGGCTESIKYCIEVIETPEVSIISSANSICAGQTVYLEAISDNAVEYSWIYGEQVFSKTSEAQISIDVQGDHIIDLITKTSCLCPDTTSVTISVIPEKGPEIDCITPTHVGEPQTYYATDVCAVYNWSIGPQGIITDGGGLDDDFVTVEWSDGPEGEISLSTSGCDDDICPGTTTEIVPVILPNITIEGPSIACKDEQSQFTVPLYPGTVYNWSLSGNGYIIDGHQTNQITVQWNDFPGSADQATLTLDYENCLLDCVGSATKTIDLLERFFIGAEQAQVCEGGNLYVAAQSGWDYPNADFNFYDPSGTLIQSYTNDNFVNFSADSGPGSYVIEAIISGGYCNTRDQGLIEVTSRPESLSSIDGPLTICKNETYNYKHNETIESIYNLNWSFNDGGSISNVSGSSVRYTWTSDGPYSVTVVVEDLLNRCESDALTLDVNATSNGNITGENVLCFNETGAYTIQDSQVESTWTITPDNAGVIYIVDETSIEVTWIASGIHTLTSTSCGVTDTYTVEVLAQPVFNIAYEPEICANEFTRLTVTGGAFSNVEIIDEDLNSYNISDDIPSGFYKVTVEDDNGCTAEEQFRVDELPLPDIFISTPDEEGFCLPDDPPRTLYALNTEDGYTYQWYRDGVPNGGDEEILTTKTFGSYYVEVTDINGCQNSSNVLVLYEDCREPGECRDGRCPGPCRSNDQILMTSSNQNYCNEFEFSNVSTSGHDPASIFWHFDDRFAGADSISYDHNPTHTFSHAGFYEVILFGLVPDADNPGQWCLDYDWEVLEVPVAANYYAHETCRGDIMQFENTSTFIPGRRIVSYSWNFGDPLSAANTSSDPSPTHMFSTAGIYKVELIITAESGCISRIVKDVEVFDGPDLDFDLPLNRCFGDGLKFEMDDPHLSEEEWMFENPMGMPTTISGGVAIHKYDVAGIYDVTLSAKNIYGCSSSLTKPVEVGGPTLSGEITSNNSGPICEGETVNLQAPNGGVEYYWSNGETTQDISVTEAGDYNVTVVSGTACDHVTEPFLLEVEPRPDIYIYGIKYDDFEGQRFENVMDVCIYEDYIVRSRFVSGATFSWNLFSQNSNFISNSEIRALGVGEHKIVLTITINSSGCSYESDPFILRIHDRPTSPRITADQSNLCEGAIINLSVNNPDPSLKYYWNTGEEGLGITVSTEGYYYVTAVNENGCTSISNSIFVSPLPNVSLMPSGCFQVCYPYEVCAPAVSNVRNYQWLKDGELYESQSSSPDFMANESGDYQVILETYQGCVDTSEVMTLYPEPIDHEIDGIVFIDHNQNEIYDTGDELVAGATVHLRIGNVIEQTTMTDANGYYSFDNINHHRVNIEVDISGLGLDIPDAEYVIFREFDQCQDEQECDFALISECMDSREIIELLSCTGEQVEYEGNFYNVGDFEEFNFIGVEGCDSIIEIIVLPIPEPNLTFVPSISCFNSDSGMLEIQGSLPGYSFSIDGSSFSQEVIYDNLEAGNHLIEVVDNNGCFFEYDITIDETVAFVPDLSVTSSCEGLNNGTLEIILPAGQDFMISLNGGPAVLNQFVWTDLAPGSYSVTITDVLSGCEVVEAITITESPKPDYLVLTNDVCSGQMNGIAEVQLNTPGTYEFGLDNTSMQSNTVFQNLSPGTHTLWISDESGCVYSSDFEIGEIAEPEVLWVTTESCQGESNGTIQVEITSVGNYMISVDNNMNSSNQFDFDGLAIGPHMLFVTDDNGCDYEYSFDISEYPEATVDLVTNESCAGSANGSVEIQSSEVLRYSLDGTNYISGNLITDLDPGTYTVYTEDLNGCIKSSDVEIFEAPKLEVEVEEYEFDCSIRSVEIVPQIIESAGTVSFSWNTGETAQSITASSSDIYQVQISDQCSSVVFNWDLQFDESVANENIYMPNVFDPQGIEPNKEFRPMISPEIEVLEYSFDIFDRWGNRVNTSINPKEGWDGNHLSEEAKSGVYVWMYEIKAVHCGQEYTLKKAGDVTLLR